MERGLALPLRHRTSRPDGSGNTGRQPRPLDVYTRLQQTTLEAELISQLGHVEIFLHDSLHTGRNMRFEMETV